MFAFPTSRRQGFNLAELLVGLGLLALLTATCVRVLIPSLRLTGRSSVRNGLQQQALLLMTRLERNLLRSSESSIGVRQASPGQPFLLGLQRQVSGQQAFSGTPAWERSLVLYSFQGGEVLEREYDATQSGLTLSATAPLGCSESQLLALNGRTPGHTSTLTRQALAFRVTRPAPSLVDLDVTLEDRSNSQERPYQVHFTRALALRNP